MNEKPNRSLDDVFRGALSLADSLRRGDETPRFYEGSEQTSFFVAGGPTAEQLANLSGQCSETEWLSLCRNGEFLDAACRDLESTAAVATKLLGRKISAHV